MNGRLPGYVVLTVVLSALGMRLASSATADASYLVLAALAIAGPRHAVQALAMSWLFGLLNPGIAPEAPMGAIGRYLVIVAAAFSVWLRNGLMYRPGRVSVPVASTMLLGLFICLHSIFFSPIVDVSLLKAISWLLVVATLLSAWGQFSVRQRERAIAEVFGGLIALMLASLPLLGTSVGYLRNGTGFQGLLNQPQAFGPTMAVLGAWAIGKVLASRRPPWLALSTAGICGVLVLASEARTAGFALVAATTGTVIVAPLLARRSINDLFPGFRSVRLFLLLGLMLNVALIFAPLLSDRLGSYFVKRGQGSTLVEVYDSSRGKLIKKMYANISANPVVGVGFGIASDPEEMDVKRDPVMGLPTSASVEKGVLPLAVLEEVGLFGALATFLWICMLLTRAASGGAMPLLALSTVLLINMGEATLFSPGGVGLLFLIVVAWAGTVRERGRAAQVSPSTLSLTSAGAEPA